MGKMVKKTTIIYSMIIGAYRFILPCNIVSEDEIDQRIKDQNQTTNLPDPILAVFIKQGE